jgi:hypothetical protein
VIPGGRVALSVIGVLGLPEAATTTDVTAIRIELEAPPDCATAEAFYEAVRARTERARTVREGEAGVRVVVRLNRVGTRAHGELRVIGEHGESDTRRVDGGTCTEVVEALSLTVALAVDPTAMLGPAEHAVEPAQPAPPPPPPPPPPPDLPAEPPGELEVRLALHGGGMGQVTPFVSFGGDVSVRVVAPWRAASSFGVGLRRYQNDLFRAADNASMRATLIALTACPKRFGDAHAFTLEPCALGLGGWLGATGRGVEERTKVVRSYFALGAVLLGSAPIAAGLSVELEGGLVVPLVKRRYVLSNPERQVGETPSIAALGSLGLTYSF